MSRKRRAKRDAAELWRFCVIDGTVDEGRARQVVDDVIKSRHTSAPAILSSFLRLAKLDRDRRSARVESASPLDADVKAAIERGLASRYGRDITTTFAVDPSLIGGTRVRVGSDVYDASVKGGLERIAAGL